jgi:hypothetical protein
MILALSRQHELDQQRGGVWVGWARGEHEHRGGFHRHERLGKQMVDRCASLL